MILKEIMREHCEVHKLDESGRIIDAATMMREQRIGSVVIVDDSGKVTGIITDRDIALGLAFGAATSNSFVTELMTRDVKVVNQQMTLFDVTRFFRTAQVKRLPVVNGDGHPVGIVSVDDVMACLSREMIDTCSALSPKLGHLV